MKKLFLILGAILTGAIALTLQQQSVAAFNDNNIGTVNSHTHQSGSGQFQFGSTWNNEDVHVNQHYNAQTGDYNYHEVIKP